MGIPATISTLFGFTSQAFDRRLKPSASFSLSLIFSIITLTGFLYCGAFPGLMIFSLIGGLSRIFWIPITKRLFSAATKDDNNFKNVFRIRYITICAASVIGPGICSLFISYISNIAVLYLSIIIYLIIIIFLQIIKENIDKHRCSPAKEILISSSLSNNVNIVLISYIIGGGLVYMVFCQFEFSFALFLKFFFKHPELVFSNLLIANAILGIIFQIIFMNFSIKLHNKTIILIGNILFAAGYLFFGLSSGNLFMLIVGVVIYSIGEILTIPALDIAIDEISTADNKTLYFGLSEFRCFGFTLGPIFASCMLAISGPFLMCVSASCIIFLSSFFFYTKNKTKSKSIASSS